MANVIVGIHGLANKPKREVETGWWEKSIREGLKKTCDIDNANFTYRMVYWSDLLYKSLLHDDLDFKFDALYNNEPYIEAQSLKKYEEGWLDAVRESVLGAGGAALDALKGYVGMDGLANKLLEKTLKDLAFYYEPNRQIRDRNGQRRPVRLVLQDELKSTLRELQGQHIMLIAHSMGSIIAYDVLRDLGQERPTFALAHFVTIGSPLGLPHVKMKVHEERNKEVRTPSVVTERWVNYADRRDPVAVDVHLADDYGPNGRTVQVKDALVLNDYPLPKDKPNRHKSYGYLRTPEISEHIQEFIAG
jgi:Alpha/beta hydrolase of unknown function (DUF900)